MSMEDKNLKKFQSTSALLTLLVVGFVSLFAVGCGDSRENFVFTGNNNQANTGNLVFRFQQAAAQTVDIVPAGTATLRFDFFTNNPPTLQGLLFTETRAFADVVTFNNVSPEVRSVTVTCFNAAGLPLATLFGPVTVNVGQTTEVDLNDAQPVAIEALTSSPDPIILTVGQTQQVTNTGSFNQGSTATIPAGSLTYNLTEAAGNLIPTATVSSTGLVSFVNRAQNATLTSSFTFGGQTRSDTVLVRTVEFDCSANPDTLLVGQNNSPTYTCTFRDSDRTTELNVTANSTFALQSGPAGVTVNPTSGVIFVPENANTSVDVVIGITWNDARPASNPLATGRSFTDDVTFQFPGVGNL